MSAPKRHDAGRLWFTASDDVCEVAVPGFQREPDLGDVRVLDVVARCYGVSHVVESPPDDLLTEPASRVLTVRRRSFHV